MTWACWLSQARDESILDPGWVQPNLILASIAVGQKPRRSFVRRSLGGSAPLHTQTRYSMRSWVGIRIRQTILTGRRVVRVSPLPG
ncbi:hypothetical protein PanWU01x14_346780 [Parasponia andersonii]|uniref:Uncharacterized protein n=1 Tax=Parasponia andersonii TaxID=3476 RepID=A0A2P5AC67_PARAD|nr:hypothetical protein PanWU01x14_346780 [Parasponia andersonii]